MARVLVVDDEPGVQESLRMLLKGDCQVETASSVDAAIEAVDAHPPDLILLDLVMPGRSGMELLAELSERGSPPPVIVLTATKTVSTAVEAMRHGAADYVTKPFEVDALRIKVRRILEQRALESEVAVLRAEVEQRRSLGALLGGSARMRQVFRTIERVAASRATVLVTGESGTGKELVAKAIHELGPRKDAPLVVINCTAIPENLIESELFGHERGAFTGARERHIGKFEAASGGTLFLDEIGELSPAVQAGLLRALQERTIERVGGTQPIPVDVRVLAATHRDLEHEVEEGRFRPDLYYRINVVPLAMPPLRERREDVRLLAEAFLARARAAAGRGPRSISAQALASLEGYSWPGNVRELENAIERGVTLAEGDALEVTDLPEAVRRAGHMEALREGLRAGRGGFEEAVAQFEAQLLREALDRTRWNQTQTAEQLGITRRVLKLKMDKHGLSNE